MTEAIGILGPGALGCSAAQWAAQCGLETRLLGRDLAHAEGGLLDIHRRWDRAVAKGALSLEGRAAARSRLQAHPLSRASVAPLTTLLEALPEEAGTKAALLEQAAHWGGPDLLLLSGTSAIPISELAERAGLQGRLVGFHLFVPVPRMAVVEMAVAPGTDSRWVDRARSLGTALRKRVVQVRDQPGFAAARMALAQGLEAMRLLEEGAATAEDLDALMTLGYGHPVGPLELSDRVGLDLRLRIADRLAQAGLSRFDAPALLRQRSAEGATGLRSGRGFFRWQAGARMP